MGGFETAAIAALGAVQNHQRTRAQNAIVDARQQAAATLQHQARKIHEREQRGRLASLQAAQRARFGAAGVGNGGSADAVLNGLAEQTERSIRDDRTGDQFSMQGRAAVDRQRRKLSLIDYQRGQVRNLLGVGHGVSLLER